VVVVMSYLAMVVPFDVVACRANTGTTAARCQGRVAPRTR
jgi:hypothetical protein